MCKKRETISNWQGPVFTQGSPHHVTIVVNIIHGIHCPSNMTLVYCTVVKNMGLKADTWAPKTWWFWSSYLAHLNLNVSTGTRNTGFLSDTKSWPPKSVSSFCLQIARMWIIFQHGHLVPTFPVSLAFWTATWPRSDQWHIRGLSVLAVPLMVARWLCGSFRHHTEVQGGKKEKNGTTYDPLIRKAIFAQNTQGRHPLWSVISMHTLKAFILGKIFKKKPSHKHIQAKFLKYR